MYIPSSMFLGIMYVSCTYTACVWICFVYEFICLFLIISSHFLLPSLLPPPPPPLPSPTISVLPTHPSLLALLHGRQISRCAANATVRRNSSRTRLGPMNVQKKDIHKSPRRYAPEMMQQRFGVQRLIESTDFSRKGSEGWREGRVLSGMMDHIIVIRQKLGWQLFAMHIINVDRNPSLTKK